MGLLQSPFFQKGGNQGDTGFFVGGLDLTQFVVVVNEGGGIVRGNGCGLHDHLEEVRSPPVLSV